MSYGDRVRKIKARMDENPLIRMAFSTVREAIIEAYSDNDLYRMGSAVAETMRATDFEALADRVFLEEMEAGESNHDLTMKRHDTMVAMAAAYGIRIGMEIQREGINPRDFGLSPHQ